MGTNVCKVLLINCKAKSSRIRSKLRRLKKLLPLIWLSIAMPMLSWLTLRNVLNSKSKNWQSQELRAVAHHNLCKKHASKCQNHQHFLHFCHKNACLSGLLETGGRGGNCPSTFAEILTKLLKNLGVSLKFLFFAPHFWSCSPTCRQVPTPLFIQTVTV